MSRHVSWLRHHATIAAESQTKDPLADAILARVRERLTPASASTADLEASRIRAFTQSVASLVVYKTPSDRLQAAALAAIDSASERPATASDLVRAAIVGVLDSIGHGAKLVNMRDALQLQRPITTFRDVGNIRVISPAFTPERGTFGCDGFNQYFDLSDSRVTGLILDLRGNQGGSPQMAFASRIFSWGQECRFSRFKPITDATVWIHKRPHGDCHHRSRWQYSSTKKRIAEPLASPQHFRISSAR